MKEHRGVTYRQPKSSVKDGDPVVARFRKALSDGGVPDVAAQALIRKIREAGAASRAGLLSDERCRRVVDRLVVATHSKARDLAS